MRTSDLDAIQRLLSRQSIRRDLLVIRLSSKAKRLLFKSSFTKGVEIVVPFSADPSWVADMAQKQVEWIREAQDHVREGRRQINPSQINLKALGETWSVNIERVSEGREGLLVSGKNSLTVVQDPNDMFHVARELQAWFHQKARDERHP